VSRWVDAVVLRRERGSVRGIPLAFVASAISVGETIDVPAGARAGDLAILADFAITPAASVVPTNWTQIGTTLGTTNRRITSRRVLTGGEGTITGMVGATNTQKAMLVFRKRPSGLWGAPTKHTEQSTTSAPTNQVITATPGPSILLAVYCGSGGASTRGFTPAQDAEVAVTGARLHVRYKIHRVANPETTITMNDDGSNILSSFRVPVL